MLPNNEASIFEAKNKQVSVLNRTKLVDVFAPYRTIEKTDSTKVSHFILQYNVEYDGKYKNHHEITNFAMELASEYVKANFD